MSRDKQISEMAKILCGMKNDCDGCIWDKVHCNERNYAEEIYNAGYRKASEVVDEFIKAMIDKFGVNPYDRMNFDVRDLVELKKKYTESEKDDGKV